MHKCKICWFSKLEMRIKKIINLVFTVTYCTWIVTWCIWGLCTFKMWYADVIRDAQPQKGHFDTQNLRIAAYWLSLVPLTGWCIHAHCTYIMAHTLILACINIHTYIHTTQASTLRVNLRAQSSQSHLDQSALLNLTINWIWDKLA